MFYSSRLFRIALQLFPKRSLLSRHMATAAIEKQMVGEAAAQLVKDGMNVGVGTGSTADFFIKKLGERVRNEGLKVLYLYAIT